MSVNVFQDAHTCLIDFDTDTNTSLFAVYDGHGGTCLLMAYILTLLQG